MNDIDLFSYIYLPFKIKKPIRLIELFAGIGSQAKALKNLGANFEHYRVVEWDKYAIASYNAIHGTNFETSDICKLKGEDLGIVNSDEYCYIVTYSFPCQDLSLAGKGKGMSEGSSTRSGLLWEVERLLDECNEKPQVLLMENVPQVIGKKHIKDFQLWRRKLEQLGYSNYVKLLNAKDYGIPQNRNRCFMVSILGDYFYEFPRKQKLKLKLKDMLEEKVEEKYYLSKKMIEYISSNNEKRTGNDNKSIINKQIASTINTGEGSRRCDSSNYVNDTQQEYDLKQVNRIGGLFDKTNKRNEAGSIYDVEGLSPTLTTNGGGYHEPLIVEDSLKIKEATKKGYAEATGGGRRLHQSSTPKKRCSSKRNDTNYKNKL